MLIKKKISKYLSEFRIGRKFIRFTDYNNPVIFEVTGKIRFTEGNILTGRCLTVECDWTDDIGPIHKGNKIIYQYDFKSSNDFKDDFFLEKDIILFLDRNNK